MILDGLDDVETWDAVIDAEPALAVVLSWDRFDAALLAIANFVDLKSPYSLGHSRAVADLAAAGRAPAWPRRSGGADAASRRARARLWPARGLERDLGQARTARRRRVGARAPAPVSDRADAPAVGGARAAGRDRGTASRAPRRLGLPARLSGAAISRPARILAAADAYQAMREPRPHRPERSADEAAAELRADVRAGRLDARGRRGGSRRRRSSRLTPPRRSGRSHRARGRGPQTARARAVEQGDRQAARDLAQDRRQPHRAHLLEDRRLDPCQGEPVRDATRTAARGGVRCQNPRPKPRRRASAQPPCIIACMFLAITASTARSSSLGLNWTSSLPASASGTWPGGR